MADELNTSLNELLTTNFGLSPSGYTGSRGDSGFVGSQGPAGGYTGSRGDAGYVGSQGDTGTLGYTGSQGTGYTGSQGLPGEAAAVGYTGSEGADGAQGYTGSKGFTGFVGSQGLPGAYAAVGYTGSRGTDGVIGVDGYTGSRGDTGLGFAIAKSYASVAALTADTAPTDIAAGQFAIIETGSVDDADNSRLYLWSGTAYSYVTDLSGAAGITGPAGSAGFTGSAGTAGANGFTGSSGAGFTGSAGTNATNGTATFVAAGTIANGTVVALNSNGTVSVVAQSDVNLSYTNQVTISGSYWGNSGSSYNPRFKAVYNPTNNLLYIVYVNGSTGYVTVEIGTISGSTISFTAVTSTSSYFWSYGLDAHWNPVSNSLLIIGSSSSGSCHYITATHTAGPGLTFSGATQWANSSSYYIGAPKLAYNSSNDSYVFFYRYYNAIRARALKLGTGLGTETSIVTGFSSDNNIYYDATYDVINNQVILAYSGPGLTSSFVKTITVTGTSLSQGSATAFLASQLYGLDIAVNSTGTGLLILHTTGNGANATAGTISGGTFTFGSSTVINASAGSESSDLIFDVVSGRYIATTMGAIVDITVSGITVTKNTTVTSVTNQYAVSAVYIPSLQKIVVGYGAYNSALVAGIINPFQAGVTNAGSWIGISANAAVNAASVLVTTLGGINTSVTGLTTNTVYYVNPTGGVTATPTSYGKIGIATATNKILLTDTNFGYTGSAGAVGFTGSIGFTGSRGTTGFTGSVGFVGSSGAGFTGSAGADGVIGYNGSTGYTGSQGETGLGFRVAKSYASVAALTADTAPTGIVAGEFAIIETGSVEDADNSRLYLWSGSAYSYVTDLSGAAGITGPQGNLGYTGSVGPAGINGSSGLQGETGYTGSQGIPGEAAAVGYTGSQGFVGSAGAAGSQGQPGIATSSLVVDLFTGTGSQTAFALTVTPTGINQTAVNIDGVGQIRNTYSLTNNVLTFSEAPAAGANVEVTVFVYGTASFVNRIYAGDGVTTAFAVTSGVTAESILVSDNGIVQRPGTDYSVSASTLTFVSAPLSGSSIQIREIPAGSVGYTGSASTVAGYTGSTGAFSGTVDGNLSVSGTTFVTGDILPTSNNTVNIGSPTARFGTLYLAANTIDLGGTTISTSPTGDLVFVTASGTVDITANTVNFLNTVSTTAIAPGESIGTGGGGSTAAQVGYSLVFGG